ncbi:MAG: alpha/beta hydrolase [Saprospiraceae bacterium]|nr:alpha/beta hydrolase [Saprospiraceae bacterium]
MDLNSWQNGGHYFESDSGLIYYREYHPKKEKTLVFLHGYPTSCLDYKACIKYFTNYRIIVHDHLGFGLSDKPEGAQYLLTEQADVAVALWQYLKVDHCTVVAHDYGTSVATELLARHNAGLLSINIESLVLCNGSMLIEMSQLRPIQRMLKHRWLGPLVARLASFNTFKRNMNRIAAAGFTHDNDSLNLHWTLLTIKGGRKVLSKITGYIDQRYEHYDRWIGALSEFTKPTLILWGAQDPVAVIAMSDKLSTIIPNNKVKILEHCGHYPMLEDAQSWSKAIIEFLN